MATLDEGFVLARSTLLDTLEVLADHRDAVIVVGAQAVYLHAPGGLAMPQLTLDADLLLDTDVLGMAPNISATLEGAGYLSGDQPGAWTSPGGVHVDLMTAHDLSDGGRRSAALRGHPGSVARRTAGLEVAVIDNEQVSIDAIGPGDARSIVASVAGPAALVVAKLTKIRERLEDGGRRDRVLPKDAGDLLRLLRMCDAEAMGVRLAEVATDHRVAPAVSRAIGWARRDISLASSELVRLTTLAAQGTEPDRAIDGAMRTLLRLLLDSYERSA